MNTIADITKVIKDGQIYVKRSDVIKYVGDSILKKKFDRPDDSSMEITLGELWDLTNTDVKLGNPKMPVVLYNKSFFENIPQERVSDTVWDRIQNLLKTVFAEESKDTNNDSFVAAPIQNMVSNDVFLKGCDMIVAAIEKNAAETNKLLATILNILNTKEKISNTGNVQENENLKKEKEEKVKKFTVKSKIVTKKNSLNSDPDYVAWREHVMSQCSVSNSLVASTLRLAYQKMNKCYGIVWEQERKEFVEHYGSQPDNTMQIAYYLEKKNPAHKNLLASCVYDVAHSYYTEEDANEKHSEDSKDETSKPIQTEASTDYEISKLNDISTKIAAFAKARQLDDKVLLSKFYNRVRGDSQVNYHRLCKDYKRRNNIGRDEIVNVLDVLDSTQNSRRRTMILYSKFMAEYGIKIGA